MKFSHRFGNDELARWVIEGLQRAFPDNDLSPLLEKHGFRMTLESIIPMHTDEQNRFFHFLLKTWIDEDPAVLAPLEQEIGRQATDKEGLIWLKRRVQIVHFGVVQIYDEHGNEHMVPVKTLSGEWDWSIAGYKRKQLTREEFRNLIDRVYRLADPIELPEPEQQ